MQERTEHRSTDYESNLLGIAKVYGITRETIGRRADEIYEKKWGSKTDDALNLNPEEFDARVNSALAKAFQDIVGSVVPKFTQPPILSWRFLTRAAAQAGVTIFLGGLTIVGLSAITRVASKPAESTDGQTGEEGQIDGGNISPFDTNQDLSASPRPRKIM